MPKLADKNYTDDLRTRLKDPAYAAEYLNAVLQDDEEGACEVFLLALRDVAMASTMSQLARSAEINRENLYRVLSKNGNPKLSTLLAVLKTLNLGLSIRPIAAPAKRQHTKLPAALSAGLSRAHGAAASTRV